MKTIILFIIILLNLIRGNYLNAQAPEIIWQHSYGGSDWDQANAVRQTPDGGFIVVGYSGSSDGDVIENKGLYDYWLLKLDSFGEIEWQKSFGGSNYDYCYDAQVTNDGGYILAGDSWSMDGDVTGNHDVDYWVVKTDNTGNIEWQKCYGGTGYDQAQSIQQTEDGGYIIAGKSGSDDGDVTGHHGGSEADYWVVKIDPVGTIEWQKSIGTEENDYASCVIQTIDSGYIVSGAAQTIGDISDYWIVKLDNSGNLIWEKSFGGSDSDDAYSIIQSADGGFLTVGVTYSNDGDITGYHGGIGDGWEIKIDSLGNLLWQKVLGGSGGEYFHSIVPGTTNNCIAIGLSSSFDGDLTENKGSTDVWIVNMDSSSEITWQKTFGGTLTDVAFSLIKILDENYIFAGYSKSSDFDLTENHGDFDYWVVKLAVCNTHWYSDADGDSFGNLLIDSVSCNLPSGFVSDNNDCDDTNPNIHPGAEEILNGLDDDCDGSTDENLSINNALLDAIKIYPNPAETILHIQYVGNEGCRVEIYSATGEVIYRNELSSTTTIDISKFASGIYFMKIMGGDGEAGVKVVKEY